MISDDDFAKMSDPEFLAERARVREQLEHTAEVSAELAARYQRLNDKFDRRASAAWAASDGGTGGGHRLGGEW